MNAPYYEGRDAFFADVDPGACPYPDPSAEREWWFQGRYEAQQDTDKGAWDSYYPDNDCVEDE
jgi:hypothetical protein